MKTVDVTIPDGERSATAVLRSIGSSSSTEGEAFATFSISGHWEDTIH
ncbi:MAG TPA: hypothetical protein VGB19_11945 [Actinomycetota bacterium]